MIIARKTVIQQPLSKLNSIDKDNDTAPISSHFKIFEISHIWKHLTPTSRKHFFSFLD